MWELHYCVIPMSVHQVVSSECLCLVEVFVAIGRSLYRALYCAYIDEFLLVR